MYFWKDGSDAGGVWRFWDYKSHWPFEGPFAKPEEEGYVIGIHAFYGEQSYGWPLRAYRQQTLHLSWNYADVSKRRDHQIQRWIARWTDGTAVEYLGDTPESDVAPELKTKSLGETVRVLPWIEELDVPERVFRFRLAGNLGFWWVVFFGLLLLPGGVRRLVRRVRGRCVGCGYEAGGLAVCPECGRVKHAVGVAGATTR